MLLNPTCSWNAHVAHIGAKMVAFAFAAAVTRVDFIIAGGVGLIHGVTMLILSQTTHCIASKVGLSVHKIAQLNQALNIASITTTLVALSAIGMMTIELSLAFMILLGVNYYSYWNNNHPVAPPPAVYSIA